LVFLWINRGLLVRLLPRAVRLNLAAGPIVSRGRRRVGISRRRCLGIWIRSPYYQMRGAPRGQSLVRIPTFTALKVRDEKERG
jgi:hypothetical protein